MNDVCLALCLVWAVGFIGMSVLTLNYILDQRAVNREVFDSMRSVPFCCGVLVASALWPIIVAFLAVSAIRLLTMKKGVST